MQVTDVGETYDKNRAKKPESIVKKTVMLTGFWRRKEAFHNIKVGDTIRTDVDHPQQLSDHLSVIETFEKVEKR